MVKGWRQKATSDAAVIPDLFAGAAGVGIPCGPDNDLICFDVDLGHTDDPDRISKLNAWVQQHWAPDEFMCRKTRSGGLHIIARWPEGKAPRRLMPKLDVIIDGFYFVWCTEDGAYSHIDGVTSFDQLLDPTPEMLQITERDTLGTGSALMTVDEAHDAMWSDGDAGIRHDALLRMTQDWAEEHAGDALAAWCGEFEAWFRDIYGDRIDAARLDTLLEWDVDDERGELYRAFKGVRMRPEMLGGVLAKAGAKLERLGLISAPPLAEVATAVAQQQEFEAASSDISFDVDDGVIPPRPWMLGTYLIKGKVTTLSAPGGTGKSVLALVWAMCMATGRTLLSTEPHHKARVLVWSGEDDRTEMRRRLRAIQIRHEAQPSGNLAIETAADRDLRLVTKNEKGQIVIHKPKVEALAADLKRAGVEVLVLDPLISMHGVNENDNAEMDMVMDQLIEIAEEANVAVLVIHHVAKGALRDDRRGDPADAARGATAIVNRARVALALRVMSEDEATKLQLSMGQRFSYVQVIDAKANLSVRSGYGSSDWVQLVSQPIDNGDDDYPDGDSIGVPIRYEMAALMVQDIEAFILVVDAMEAETALLEGQRRNKAHPANSHWFGNLVGASCDLSWGEYSKQEMRTAAQQAAYQRTQEIITSMLTEQLIEKADVPDQQRHLKPGYRLTLKARARIEVLRAKLEAKS